MPKQLINKFHWNNMTAAGTVMILVGLCLVFFDLYRIYRIWTMKKWIPATATVSALSRVGSMSVTITFTYYAYEGYTRQFKSSQTVPKDSWSESLALGRLMQVYYDPNKPERVQIEQRQLWNYIFFATLNSLWLILGVIAFLANR